MIENVVQTRYRQVERLNGRFSVWWHYNRLTLVILLSAIAALAWIIHIERIARIQAQTDAVIIANTSQNLSCYAEERSTSLIIAGGSQKLVDDALRTAVYQIDAVRGEYIAARDRVRKAVVPSEGGGSK